MAAQYSKDESSGDGSVSWENGAHCIIPEVKIGGKAEQTTYTGKNLFDMSQIVTTPTKTDMPYISEVGDDYVVITSPEGTPSNSNGYTNTLIPLKTLAPQLEIGKTYVVSGDTESKSKAIYFQIAKTSVKFGSAFQATQEILDGKLVLYGYSIAAGQSRGDCRVSRIQIEEGTDATDYEPYTGGVPAPNPNYPIEPVFSSGTKVRATNDAGFDGGEATAPELLAIPGTEYRDEWDPQTGRGVRRIEKVVLDGNESWDFAYLEKYGAVLLKVALKTAVPTRAICNRGGYFTYGDKTDSNLQFGNTTNPFVKHWGIDNVDDWKAYLAAQYAAGTPVTVWYVSAEPVPFQTDPQPLVQPKGTCHLIQTDGTLDDCPIDARYVTHS